MNRPTFEELIESAAGDDGATPTIWRSAPPVDVEALLQAWSIERSRSIECEILLKLSRAAIAQLMAAGQRSATPDHLRNLRALLRQIDSQLHAPPTDRA